MGEEKKKSKSAAIMAERKENTARQTQALEAEGFRAEDATMSAVKANIMAFVMTLPVEAVFLVAFRVLHRDVNFFSSINSAWGALVFCLATFLSIPVHEGLHGLGWIGFTKLKGKSIQFGVMWNSLTPYCHCREPLLVEQYFIGLLLPFTVLGVIPCIAALVTGSGPLLLFGAINVLMAGGDITIAWLLLKYLGRDVRILDHPDQVGAVAFVRTV